MNKTLPSKFWRTLFYAMGFALLFVLTSAPVALAQTSNALCFNGAQYVSCGTLNPTTFTMEAWVYPNIVNVDQTVFSTLNEGLGKGVEFHIYSDGIPVVTVLNGASWLDIKGTSAVNAGEWVHLALSYDGSVLKVYIDGVLAVSTSFSSYAAGTSEMTLGRRSVGASGNFYFSGLIDEVRVWNAARSESEINSTMLIPLSKPTSYTALKAYYTFNQGVANGNNSLVTMLVDASSSGLNGTLHNFSLSGTSSNWVSGITLLNVTSLGISGLSATTATINGNVYFGDKTAPGAHGFCWNNSGSPTVSDSKTNEGSASGTGAFASGISGLTANTTYYARAYATSASSTAYGNEIVFTTLHEAPVIAYNSPQVYIVGTTITNLAPVSSGGTVPANTLGKVSTFAGSGSAGSDNGNGITASFYSPEGVTTDLAGNVYVADAENKKIRKITPEGVVTTLAGSGSAGSDDGTGTAASFGYPTGVATDLAGNVYVADRDMNKIRKITPGGVVTTLAGSGSGDFVNGTGTAASFHFPISVATDYAGNVYVADQSNHAIRKITPGGVVTTLAGSGSSGSDDGTGTAASFNYPAGVATDLAGNVYVADAENHRIRKITPGGVVTTLGVSASDGSSAPYFSLPLGVATDLVGNVYVADFGNKIRVITPEGVVGTLAGKGSAGSDDGTGTAASFSSPTGVATDLSGNVYVADRDNNKIRKITLYGYSISPELPAGLTFDATTGTISGTPTATSPSTEYTITAANSGGTNITTLTLQVSAYPTITTLAVTSIASNTATVEGSIASLGYPSLTAYGVCWNTSGSPTVSDSKTDKGSASATGSFTSEIMGLLPNTKYYIRSYAVNALNTVYGNEIAIITPREAPVIAYGSPQTYIVNTTITNLVPVNSGGIVPATTPGQVATFAGSGMAYFADGTGVAASFYTPNGVATDLSGNVYVADRNNHKIRKITPEGVVTTLAGSGSAGSADGTGTDASFRSPTGVVTDLSGNVYVADRDNYKIRKITPGGVVTTLAGSGSPDFVNGIGTAASFKFPISVATDLFGNIYVTDITNQVIRKINPEGVVTTFAGSGSAGSDEGTGTAASFNSPSGVATDLAGNVYVGDKNNNKIRKITPEGIVTTLAGSGSAGSDDGIGTASSFNSPSSVATDLAGNVYVADAYNYKIRKITPEGVVTTLAGSGSSGSDNGIGTAASFKLPTGVATDLAGNVYVADAADNKIRKITQYGYSISPELPAGLNFDVTTGTISGTPTATSPSTKYTIIATNNGGTGTTTINIMVGVYPTVTTLAVTSIASNTATVNGYITSSGYPNPTAHGVCWNTTGNPTIADSKTDNGAASATGEFITSMTLLAANTTYYVRAYATNTTGTSYGETVSFTTKSVYTITASAETNGTISPSGEVSVDEGGDRTFTITPNAGYRIANVLVDGSSKGAVNSYTFSNVVANHTIVASFEASTYAVTFTVTNSVNAVPGASISINSQTLTTDASGVATVSLVNGSYGYTVSATGYAEATGTAIVSDAALSVPVNLTSMGIDDATNTSLLAYPNPFADKLTIVGRKWGAGRYTITSIIGTIVAKGVLDGERTTLNLSHLKNGVYLLQINFDGEVQIIRLVKA